MPVRRLPYLANVVSIVFAPTYAVWLLYAVRGKGFAFVGMFQYATTRLYAAQRGNKAPAIIAGFIVIAAPPFVIYRRKIAP